MSTATSALIVGVAFASSVKYLVVHIIVPEQVCDNVISSFCLPSNETSRYRARGVKKKFELTI